MLQSAQHIMLREEVLACGIEIRLTRLTCHVAQDLFVFGDEDDGTYTPITPGSQVRLYRSPFLMNRRVADEARVVCVCNIVVLPAVTLQVMAALRPIGTWSMDLEQHDCSCIVSSTRWFVVLQGWGTGAMALLLWIFPLMLLSILLAVCLSLRLITSAIPLLIGVPASVVIAAF